MGYYANFQSNAQLYNNIFYNARASTGSPGFQTGRHYSIKTNYTGLSSTLITYNNCAADKNGGTFGGSSSSDFNTLADFKNYNSGSGTFCFSSDPQYNNPLSSPPDLNLPLNNKQSNGGARLNSFFSTDFNGNTRSIPSANRPDMGAFEADYGDPTIDLQEPYIYYGAIQQDLVTNSPRTLTNIVYVSDNKSMSNTNPPRLYFKRSDDPNANLPVATNSSADPMGWRYNSGTTSDIGGERNYSFVIDYSLMNPSSTLTGDATYIQYFVTAEDNSGNFNSNGLGANPGTPLVNVTSQPTTTIFNYALRNGIQGTYYIKAGGAPLFNTFASFSNYYNTGIITGDITLILGGDIIGNDQIGLSDGNGNQNPNNYKVTDIFNGDLRIRPNFAESYYVKGMGYPVTNPSVSTDFNGTPRSTSISTGSTTIGAFEVTPSVEANPIVLTGPFDIGQEYPIYDNNRYYGTIKFNSAVQPTSLSLYYYGGINPPNATVLGRSGANIEEFIKGASEDLLLIINFLKETDYKFPTDAFEVRLPEDLVLENDADAMYVVLNNISSIFKENLALPIKKFFELPLKNEWKSSVNNFASALKRHNEFFGQDDDFPRSGFKMRTGGVEASAFPTIEQIAYVINTCYENQLPLKFTAGLHHPIRHYNDSVQTKMHGFLNVFGAGILLYGNDLLEQDLINILSDETADNFIFDDNYFRWKEFKSPMKVIENARKNFVISYGSCSFDEPREDLKNLNLL
ncbi:unnamed protein product [Rotaria sp. Silwood1]|nr:unnamed protein product [Rotaria sp. Silwood1]